MTFSHFEIVDDLHNHADFFLNIGKIGSGYAQNDRAITLLIFSEDVCGKHTFYTGENSFFVSLDIDYVFKKYGASPVLDLEKTIESNLKEIIELRWCRNISSGLARECFDFLKSVPKSCRSVDEFDNLAFEALGHIDFNGAEGPFHIYEKWSSRQINFWEKMWKRFAERADGVIKGSGREQHRYPIQVKIKTWDEMVNEYGEEEDGVIQCGFVSNMESFMPEDRIIECFPRSDGTYSWVVDDGREEWQITDDMIKEIE